MPFVRLVARDFFQAAARRDAVRLLIDDAGRVAFLGVLVAVLDQQPSLLARLAAVFAAMRADQRPDSLELFAVELELEVALLICGHRIPDRMPGAAIPHHHGARSVLARRNDAFEAAVFERMVFDVHRQPLVVRVEARTFGHRPAQQHTVQLEPEVVVQMAGRMLLDDEAQLLRLAADDAPARLGRGPKIALLAVAFQSHACRPRSGPLPFGRRAGRSARCSDHAQRRFAGLALRAARVACLASRRALVEALLQQGGEVDDLRRAGLLAFVGRSLGDLLGFAGLDLLVDAAHQVFVIGVLELLRLPVLGHVVDQAFGEIDFLAADAGALQSFGRQLEAAGAADLVGMAHRDQHQGATLGNDGRQMLGRANDDLRDGDASGRPQGFAQQCVDLFAAIGRRQVVRRLVILRRDFGGGHEGLDVDRPGGLDVGAPEILIGQDDILIFFVLVAFDDVRPLDFLAALLAVALVSDRRKVALVQHRKLESLALFRGEKLDRYVDQAERNRTLPKRASHDLPLFLLDDVNAYAIDAQAVRHRTDDQNAAADALEQGLLAGELACALAAGEVAPMHVVRANEHRLSLLRANA